MIERSAQADALIGELQRQGAGRLTLFLGAAPGVGKTYAMLGRARELQRRGIDVVIGIVETHGRAETAALLEGLEVLPRRHIAYQGRALDELDLDALLARKTSSRTAMRPAAGTSVAGRMSSSCWTPASTCTPPSTSSTWKA